MQASVSNRMLVRSFIAGAVVLLGVSACSRSDRVESGSDNTATTIRDTAVSGATQDVPGTGQDRVAADTTNPTSENTGTGAAAGDTAPARIQSDAPRAATASPSAERQNTSGSAEPGAAGYRTMDRDTAAQHESDSARVTEDTSETSLNQADTSKVETAGAAVTSDTAGTDTATAAGYAEMAGDTTSGADQAVGASVGDSTMNAGRVRPPEDSTELQGNASEAATPEANDTTLNAGRVRPVEDSTEILGQVTTDTTSAVVATTDSAEDAGEGAVAARGADTTGNEGRIRPPEDSTEMQGNVSSAESDGVDAADTADEAPVAAEARESGEVASEMSTEPAGAAALGGTVTGADAVAMMTRQGEQCNVVDPESDEEVRWDMSSTPATLNPCGLGSMNLSKVWTEGQREE